MHPRARGRLHADGAQYGCATPDAVQVDRELRAVQPDPDCRRLVVEHHISGIEDSEVGIHDKADEVDVRTGGRHPKADVRHLDRRILAGDQLPHLASILACYLM